MASKIFINYRRGESLKDAQHLATLLAKSFGAKQIFLDVRGIDGGANWLHTIEQQVAGSDAMVALIGKGWADLKDEQGNRRLDNPDDFVRFEIAQALQRNIPVLPVLLDGAPMPRIGELPAAMVGLSLFQAMPLRTESVVRDAEIIAQRLKVLLAKQRRRGVPAWAVALSAVAALAVGIVAGPLVVSRTQLPSPGVVADLQRQLDASKAETRTAKDQLAKVSQELEQARRDLASARLTIASLQRALDAAKGSSTERDPALSVTPGSGQSFRDSLVDGRPCPLCPDLVVIPTGSFTMGSPASETGRGNDEGPQHPVRISTPVAVAKASTTRGEFAAFVSESAHKTERGCGIWTGKWEIQPDRSWQSPGFEQDDLHPVVCVSWSDAKAFVGWLSQKTGRPYRLLTEAEWEYAARAGTTDPYYWGKEIGIGKANCRGCGSKWDGKQTAPVGSFAPNAFGIYDMSGNVAQWIEDCYHDSYNGAPTDGSAWIAGDCRARVARGGSWKSLPQLLRSANRNGPADPGFRSESLGFRVGRTLTIVP